MVFNAQNGEEMKLNFLSNLICNVEKGRWESKRSVFSILDCQGKRNEYSVIFQLSPTLNPPVTLYPNYQIHDCRNPHCNGGLYHRRSPVKKICKAKPYQICESCVLFSDSLTLCDWFVYEEWIGVLLWRVKAINSEFRDHGRDFLLE